MPGLRCGIEELHPVQSLNVLLLVVINSAKDIYPVFIGDDGTFLPRPLTDERMSFSSILGDVST